GPALQTVGVAVMALGSIWTVAGPIIAGMELATLWPILAIVAAIAALIAIGYVIYRNWSTIWAGIQAAIAAVWDWIKTYWPLLAGMLLGPIGIAAALIYQYWAQIKNGAAAVWNWIRTVWPQLLTWLTYPFRMAWQYIQTAWSAIIAAAGTVIG